MEKTDIKITRFEDADFWVDVIDAGDNWEAWITHKAYGISSLMFGYPKKQPDCNVDFDFFCEIVEVNLEEYEDNYYDDYVVEGEE